VWSAASPSWQKLWRHSGERSQSRLLENFFAILGRLARVATNDVRKAAILLMSLPQDEAANLMGRLAPKQVETISIEIAKLGSVSRDEQEAAIRDFADSSPSALEGGSGGLDVARSLVERALGKNAAGTLEQVRQQIEAMPFGFLQKVDSQNLLTFIIDEHPQTIALILSHLRPAQAADIIGGLPSERQLAVIRRIANMGQTNPEIIHEVEAGLENRMESVAEILNVTERAIERSLLESLAQEDPDLVEEIRRLMFVFEDLTKFTPKDIQIVLKNVETAQWAMALKGASEELKEKVLGNMSQRAGDMLREEMEYLGPVKLSAVEQTQQQIVDIVRRLEDAGELTLETGEASESYIQ
jgi:flagellar motor switch protein FliG